MRVGYDVTPVLVSPTGVGRYAQELEQALRAGGEAEVVTLRPSERPAASTATRVSQGLRRELFYYPIGLSRQARRAGADVVHVPAPFSPRLSGRPLVMTLHDVLPFVSPELFPRGMRWHSRLLAAPALRSAQVVLTGTEHSRALAVEHLGLQAERVVVTPYGVHDRFRPDPEGARQVSAKFAIPGRYVLCVGTLEPRKNLVTAIRAFAQVARDTETRLVVAGGKGWLNQEFERELERVQPAPILTGYVTDAELVGLYSGASCFLYPSLYEGFGFPPLEAMACGAPVVTSATSTLPEVAGDAALLVDPRDEDALAAALRSVLDSPESAADLRRRGAERARRFRWARCAEQTVAGYELARRLWSQR